MEENKKILVVDDSESIRELLSLTLQASGYGVEKCSGGHQALECLDSNIYNLIITDLHMPEMDGIEFIKNVRQGKSHQYTPIIFVTTENNNSIKREAQLAGATAWIVKPFVNEKLLQVVKKLIR